SAVFEVRPQAEVGELGHRLLQAAGYRGFAHVEFAHDLRDGTFKLLEVNTRLPVWAGIAMTRRFDMGRLAYDDLTGASPRPLGALESAATWVYLGKDLYVSAKMARRGELTVRGFLAPYVSRGKVRATFAADDPRPALSSLGYLRSRVG